ncbi:MAG: helix-turn-helix domain-containing protein [Rhodoplanes sp.]
MESLTSMSSPAEAVDRAGRSASPWDSDALVALVAASFTVPPPELLSPTRRSAAAAFARQVAMYLARVCFGATFSEIGQVFGRDRTTAAHACRLVEERRDDPRLDAMLERLELACAAARPLGATGDRR